MGTKTKFYANIESFHDLVTGSCNLVSVVFPNNEKIRFLVDCGLFYPETEAEKKRAKIKKEEEEQDTNEFGDAKKKKTELTADEKNAMLGFNAENIDFVLVTHNHVDHTGRLPLLIKKGYRNKFYMSDVTSQIIRPALNDSYKVLKEKSQLEGKKLIYTTDDVEEVLNRKVGINFNETVSLNEHVKVTFLKNGHLIGASLILVQISYKDYNGSIEYEDINLLFTGDYKKENVFFDVEKIPEWIRKLPLTIIQESTYGDTDSTDVEICLAENIIKAVKDKKQILIPAFSQQRFQEIMLMLRRLQEDNLLPEDIPIFLDGNLARIYTKIFETREIGLKEDCKDFIPWYAKFVDDGLRKIVLEIPGTKIILSTSGMGSYGPARYYIPYMLSKENALIHFSGYNAEGTMGRRILECPYGEKTIVSGAEIVKLAEVKNTSEFSGHARADEIIEFLQQFENIKCILLNHGEFDKKIKLMQRIENENVKTKKVEILDTAYFYRINAYGVVKKIPTKR